MKLAQALAERADCKQRLTQLNTRLKANAKVQENDTPAEDPVKLLEELDRTMERYAYLIRQINLTNSSLPKDGETLTGLLAKREALTWRLNILRGFLEAASAKVDRYSMKEVRVLSTVDVDKLQGQVDKLSQSFRLLDDRIQELNWTLDLIEES